MHRSDPLAPRARRAGAWLLLVFMSALVPVGCAKHPLSTERLRPAHPRSAAVLAGASLLSSAQTPVAATETATPEPATPSPTATATTTPAPAATASPEPAPVEAADPEPEPETTPEPQPLPMHAAPVRMLIPRIGVNARIVPVGVAADGAMDSPGNPFDLGWWDLGSSPGDFGSAVIGGHVDYAGYGAAVFWNLKLLRPGDQIVVEEADGTSLTFAVTEVASYRYNDTSVLDRIFRNTDQQALNLITCGGRFDPRQHNYDQRLVVYTSLLSQ